MEHLILYNTPLTKIRVGNQNDGGYVIAKLENKYDLFIAGGICDDISFEEDFIKLYPDLLCYAFDGTIDSLPNNNIQNIKFIKKNISNINDKNFTDLCEYMNNYNNIFMKIDIEGFEFKVLPVLIETYYINKIKQLVVEIHSPADIHTFPDYYKGLSDINNKHMLNMFKNINKTHTLIHLHANNGPDMTTITGIKVPHVFELTYVRNDYITDKFKNTIPLPTILDGRNVTTKKDYVLDWFPFVNIN